ncbi:MAG: PLD nuclease N-terminal domain-containing protein [Mycetocola sp.]
MTSGLGGWHLLIVLFWLVIAAGAVTLWAIALMQISRSLLEETAKAVWVLIVIIAPVLGALAWFFVGAYQAPPNPRR